MRSAERGHDPCLQIQVDLSAMLDGELDPAGVRRVTVHSDVCPSCRAFLDGIRHQVGVHKRLAQVLVEPGPFEGQCDQNQGDQGQCDGHGKSGAGAGATGKDDAICAALRRQLTDNQRKLSRILYELGRNFTLMGLSPDFSREVAQEPVPVPDAAMRGRNLLDELARSGSHGAESHVTSDCTSEWVTAKDLFDGQLRSPEENLAKGQRLLTECLALAPQSDDARIYLGLVHYARGQRALARKQFQQVVDHTSDPIMRGYARCNLSNILLDEGDCDGAIQLLLDVIDSGVVQQHQRLVAAMFNLALAYGLSGDFAASRHWFERQHLEAPHRRRWVARELSRRSHFLHLVHTHPDARALAEALSAWFPSSPVVGGTGSSGTDPSRGDVTGFDAGGYR